MRNRLVTVFLILAAWALTFCPTPAMAHACCQGMTQFRQDAMPCCALQAADRIQAQNGSSGEPPQILPAPDPSEHSLHAIAPEAASRAMLDSARVPDLQARRYRMLCVLLN